MSTFRRICKRLGYSYRKFQIKMNPVRFSERKYYKCHKRKPNLDNPTTFNEKILWITLNHHNSLYTKCADKVTVEQYLQEKLGKDETKDLLCPRYGIFDSVDDIDFDKLPQSFVLKSNHASGQVIICKDKSRLNIPEAKKDMRLWLKVNYYYSDGEWQYKNIQPKIICEKLLEADIIDYRIFCFEGKPAYIKVTQHNPNSPGGYDYAMYYPDWTKTEFKMSLNYGNLDIEKPKQLEYMLSVAQKLSEDFHFVRVDLYSVGDKVFFAELTFTPNAGKERFERYEDDVRFGSMFQLPEIMK